MNTYYVHHTTHIHTHTLNVNVYYSQNRDPKTDNKNNTVVVLSKAGGYIP
jgi:hypothetical protein